MGHGVIVLAAQSGAAQGAQTLQGVHAVAGDWSAAGLGHWLYLGGHLRVPFPGAFLINVATEKMGDNTFEHAMPSLVTGELQCT